MKDAITIRVLTIDGQPLIYLSDQVIPRPVFVEATIQREFGPAFDGGPHEWERVLDERTPDSDVSPVPTGTDWLDALSRRDVEQNPAR